MKRISIFYIILAGIFWGTSGIFVHYLAPMGLSSLQMTSVRGVVSAAVMSGYVFIHNRSVFKANLRDIFSFACSGGAMYLTAACYFGAIQASSVSTAVVLMYTAPIFVMIYSVLFMDEKLTVIKGISVASMVVGCGLVSGIVGGLKFSAMGILLGFLAGIFYSAYNILTKMQMRKKCNPVTASMYCFIFMALISMVVSNPVSTVTVAVEKPIAALLMLGCGVCTCVLPYFLYTLALKNLPVGTAASLGIVEPLSATLFSVAFLGEKLDIYSVLGIIFIIGAVFLLSREEN